MGIENHRIEQLLVEYLYRYFESLVILCDERLELTWCNSAFLRISKLDTMPIGSCINEFLDHDCQLSFQNSESLFERKMTLLFTFVGSITPYNCIVLGRKNQFIIIADGNSISTSKAIESIGKINNEMANIAREVTKKNLELAKSNAKIRELITTDYLTGLANRRCINDDFLKAVSYVKRTGLPLTIIMADLDLFKEVNDIYGHLMGDRVLVHVSKLIKKIARSEDLVGRFGGEEFIIILIGTDKNAGEIFAERLRQKIEQMKISKMPRQITMSFGVTGFLHSDTTDSAIKRADEALYMAKHQGRNKVVVL